MKGNNMGGNPTPLVGKIVAERVAAERLMGPEEREQLRAEILASAAGVTERYEALLRAVNGQGEARG